MAGRSLALVALAAGAAVLSCATPILAATPRPSQAATPAPKAPKPPPLTSFLPKGPLEEFVVAQFDIRTINSSLNVGREIYQARVMELGYRPLPRLRPADPLVLDSAAGTITISLFERGDHNSDGIEDILVCFNDRAKNGGFNATQPLVLQKYSDNTPLVALAVGVDDTRCPRSG
jgi:hypothetical protein